MSRANAIKVVFVVGMIALAVGPRHLEAQEKRYLSLLCSARSYQISGRLLIISSEDGILIFARSIRS